MGLVALTGRCLFAAAVARLSSQVLVIQKGSGEHQGEQVEEVIVTSDDNQDLQQDLGEGLCSELWTAAPCLGPSEPVPHA